MFQPIASGRMWLSQDGTLADPIGGDLKMGTVISGLQCFGTPSLPGPP